MFFCCLAPYSVSNAVRISVENYPTTFWGRRTSISESQRREAPKAIYYIIGCMYVYIYIYIILYYTVLYHIIVYCCVNSLTARRFIAALFRRGSGSIGQANQRHTCIHIHLSLSLSICNDVCMYVYVCVYIYIYTYNQSYLSLYVCIYIYIYTYTHYNN